MAFPQQALPLNSAVATPAPRGTQDYRGDHLLVAEMIKPGSKVLDVGCGDGDLLQLLESRGIDGRGIELSREGVNRCVGKRPCRGAGRRRYGLDQLSRRCVRLRDPVADAAGDAAAARRAGKSAAHRPQRDRVVSEFRLLEECACSCLSAAACHVPENLPATWYDTPNIHFCTIKDFVVLCDEINVKMERAVALDLYGRPLRLNAPWWFWNMFGEQGVFLLSRASKSAQP